ncbi:transmembrane protein 59-like [Hydractinia symbiolongicarpus]|uniref:transmembrane protein 59-like n=1 Tax=Hydractinia symbiolongicarpus TaxID=13093 RepID=UPI00254DD91A|nr:transmembrane protein 59-like [Hydractinia symbiolongicarpus]
MMLFITTVLSLITLTFCNNELCRTQCDSTYPLHTMEKVEELQACYSGCRFSYINELNLKQNENSVALCKLDCAGAFQNYKNLEDGCKIGCKPVAAITRPKKSEELYDFRWHQQLLQPVFTMQNYCVRVFYNARSYVSSTYLMEDGNGEKVIFRLQLSPQVTFGEQDENVLVDVDNDYQRAPSSTQSQSSYLRQAYDHSSKWFNCVQSKTGVPYLHVVTVLLLSLLFIAWVCCSTCDDDDDEKVEKIQRKHVFAQDFYTGGDCEKVPLFTIDPEEELALPKKLPYL